MLGARNQHRLAKLEAALIIDRVPHVAIREPAPPYYGTLMAIGLWPGDRDVLFPFVKDFHVFPTESEN